LSDIVSQSGRALDSRPALPAAQPQRSVQAAAAPAVTEARTEARQTGSISVDGNLARDMRGTFEAPAQAPAASGSVRSSAGDLSPLRPSAPPVAAAPSRPEPKPAEAGAERAGGGWVSDLLRRASQDEDGEDAVVAPGANRDAPPAAAPAAPATTPRSQAHVVDSLNSLSVDIARAIDHNVSMELWERYRNGERNVFTRRLYTMKGQQTFDEIRRKYQRDADFRQSVDRYIADFESLLADASRRDPDNSRSKGYLTSDTGKVYTMLAHASGRFD